ncbi:MAG: hypothetical protein QM736_03960 [Vicinamibacterales bacterium]
MLFNLGAIPVYRVSFIMPPGGPYEVRFISSASVRLGVSGSITGVGGEQPHRTLTLTPTKARPGDPLTFTTSGPTFGLDDRIELVRVRDGQVIDGPFVSGAGSYAMTAPGIKGNYHTRWGSGDGQEVTGPDLNLGLRGVDTFTYYDTDAIGSVRLVTDAAGAVVERHDYLPFGTEWPIPSTGGAIEHKMKFANTGRFATADPLTLTDARMVDPQRFNRYAYSRNAPVRFTDPTGLDAVLSGGQEDVDTLFTGLKQAVGDEAAKYLRKNALGLISVTDADSFKRVNAVAAALGKIIEDRAHVLTFKFSAAGTPVAFQGQQYRLEPDFPANTSGGTNMTTQVTRGPLGSLPADLMFNIEESPNSLPLILAHEVGHADALWYPGVLKSNDDALALENSFRARTGLPRRRYHDKP